MLQEISTILQTLLPKNNYHITQNNTHKNQKNVTRGIRHMIQKDRSPERQPYVGKETGDIYFFYRPQKDTVISSKDIENISFVLHPQGKHHFRLIELDTVVLSQESESSDSGITGTITKVNSKNDVIKEELDAYYEPVHGSSFKIVPAARACAEGVYAFVEYNNQTYFIYLLELPSIPGIVQMELGINTEDAFLLGIYNPLYHKNITSDEKISKKSSYNAYVPDELQHRFNKNHILFQKNLDFLNIEKMRVGLFRRGQKIAQKYTSDIHAMWEDIDTADIFHDLKLKKDKSQIEPLFYGEWE